MKARDFGVMAQLLGARGGRAGRNLPKTLRRCPLCSCAVNLHKRVGRERVCRKIVCGCVYKEGAA